MRRDINFFSVYRSSSQVDETGKFKIISLSVLSGSLVFVLFIFVFLKVADLGVTRSATDVNSFLKSGAVSKAVSVLNDANSKNVALRQYKNQADLINSAFASLPKPDSKLFADIASKEPADVTIYSFSYNGGVLTLNCTCNGKDSPAVFAHALVLDGKYKNITCQSVQEGTASGAAAGAAVPAGKFTFAISLTLTGGAS